MVVSTTNTVCQSSPCGPKGCVQGSDARDWILWVVTENLKSRRVEDFCEASDLKDAEE